MSSEKEGHKQTLAQKKRKIAGQWHPTRNSPLTPRDVTPGSNKKVWWMCGKGHEWEAKIQDRSRGRGCPYCAGKKADSSNCLQTVRPDIACEWHPTKNKPLKPTDITPGSGKKIWWTCRKGHEWEAAIYNRVKGSACPFCSGYKAHENTCLETVNPEIAAQWHPVKNRPLTAKDISPGSDKKVWWKCAKGHEWESSVYSRTRGGGCPHCVSLKNVKPGLARQWNTEKNAPLLPSHVHNGSHFQVWWKCEKGHEWKARISHRSRGSGCPYCAGKKASRENCLQTASRRLSGEWHPTKNAPITPKDVTRRSNRVFWWQCGKGHEWQQTVAYRFKGFGCPVCILDARGRLIQQ